MKIVICGLWHVHAEGYYKDATQHAEVIGVYDQNPEWRKNFAEKYNLPELSTMDEVVNSGADAAIVCTSTDTHTEVICALANAKINVFTEKVLALTSAECDKIEKAVKENGIKFVISLPQKYLATSQAAKKVVESGALGKINYFRYRNVHTGSSYCWLPPHFYNQKECGGGAMIDLGAHGMYMSEWICGMPIDAKSVFTVACSKDKSETNNIDGVEDNAVTVMQYQDGCIAVNETGFVSANNPITMEIGGENGRLFVQKGAVTLINIDGEQAVELGADLPLPIIQFCTDNILCGCGINEAKNLTKLMEMAYNR